MLIADDHPVNQKLVRWILEAAGMECDVANNGLDAVRIIEGFSAECDVMVQARGPVATASQSARAALQTHLADAAPLTT